METWVLLVATIVVWFAVEFWLVARGKPTISTEFTRLYAKWPMFGVLMALVVGLLIGHWFWTS